MGFFDLNTVPIVAEVQAAGHQRIHNFCVGSLTCYFSLTSAQARFQGSILIIDGLRGSTRLRSFVFSGDYDVKLLTELQQAGPIYSIDPVLLSKQTKFKELAYDLDTVFNPDRYPNAKKRAKRLRYPFTRLDSEGIEIRLLLPADLPAISALHKAWCDWKLAQPTTYQMMFPKRRYIACMEQALSQSEDYWAFGAFKEDKLLAARALYIEKECAFDLAHFSAAWETYNDFSEHFALATMHELHRRKITYLNCGASLNSRLSAFKSHWPHIEVISYAYGKL
jgi:hypothetical protein